MRGVIMDHWWRWLEQLRGLFAQDKKAEEAIDYLKEKLETTSPSLANPLAPSPRFPLPAESLEGPTTISLFSDGACRGNPGPGAWGAMGQDSEGEVIFQASGVETRTTNNIMELTGAIEALKGVKRYAHGENLDLRDVKINLYSDSKYVVDGITSWVEGWKRRGWKKADNKIPENLELWQQLDRLVQELPRWQFLWVRGHAGHPQNEHVDQLANQALDDSGF